MLIFLKIMKFKVLTTFLYIALYFHIFFIFFSSSYRAYRYKYIFFFFFHHLSYIFFIMLKCINTHYVYI